VGRIMNELRRHPPQAIDGRRLLRATDHWDEHTFGAFCSETDRSARNFIRLAYDDGLVVSVRPSGTEPKIKIYVERLFDPLPRWAGDGFAAARCEMDGAVGEVALVFIEQMLLPVGIVLGRPALLLSPLVSLDNRLDFAQRFLSELERQLRGAGVDDAARLTTWVDDRLRPYGADPRFLVAAGVAEHFRSRSLSSVHAQLLRRIFSLA